jgi:hypothetical protein
MEIHTRECIKLENLQDMVNIIGQQVVFLKVSSNQDYVVVKVCGKEDLEGVINIKGIGLMIKNRGLEYLHGRKVMYIREIMSMIYEKDSGRCFGLMAQYPKEIGRRISR